jgi:type I restriction enzyme S subunit
VYLLLESVFDHFQEESTGAAIPGISREQVLGLQIPLPPLPEQQRIVGVLDEAFASLTAAQAHAAQNLQNARDLFESHLNAVFTQRVEGWMEKKLGEVSQFKNGLNYNKSSGGQTLPVVGVADFQDNYLVPLSELQSATIDGVIADNYAIQPNDILTVRSNGSKHLVGRCMLVGDVDEVVSYSGFIIRIRFDAKTIFPQFLLHFMKSQVTRDFLTAGGGGANINNINQEKLSALLVPIPPYKTQVNLAAALDELREETERLTQIYEQKLAALAALKKSLLHQAFSGEL